MNQLKHKQAIVKLNNTSVVIYYSLAGKELRFPTGINANITKDKNGNFKFWDNKTRKLKLPANLCGNKLAIEKMNTQQNTIDDLLNKANNFINEYFKRDIIITVDELRELLLTNQENKVQKANTSFFDSFKDFIGKKRSHFQSRGNIISLKDYNSTKLLLEDYQAYTKKIIRIQDLNIHWLESFVQYMSVKHDQFHGGHKVSSKGEMATSTIKKRLDILSEFYGYLKELKVVTIHEVDIIKSYKKTIRKQPTHKETLDIEEIHALYKFKFKEKHYQQIRDIFVFLCLTGIRYQDLVDFDKRFIKPSKTGKGFIYQKKASKTGIDYNIPLCKIVIEILEKYKYELPSISDQYGNRVIKEALEITNLFNAPTQIIHKETRQYKKRYEAITLHKGRSSFITNLVDSTPLNELMKYTGHKKLSTLQGYIDTKREVKMDYIKVFDL